MAELIPSSPDGPATQRIVAEGSLRRCARCGLWKEQSAFHDSRTGQFSYCRDCRNAYDRRYFAGHGRAARRQRQRARDAQARAWVNSLKNGVACADCGQVFPAPLMHWDHLPGYPKVGAIGSLVGRRSLRLVVEELEKCELVCANCHAIRTAIRARRSSPG